MKMIRKLLRWCVALVILGGLSGAVYYALQPKPVSVDLAKLSRGSLQVSVQEDGKTRIRERYIVSAPLSGRLLRVELEPGDPIVRASSLLAAITPRAPEMLDARELRQAEMRVKAEQAALAQARPAVESARAALNFAESTLGRIREVGQKGAVTQNELDRAETDYRMRQEDYRSAVFAERISKYELELAKSALIHTSGEDVDNGSDLEIFSPIDGRVLRLLQESATIVTPGTPLLEIGDPTDLEVQVDVLSSDAVKIHPGANAFLERWGGDQPLKGQVRLVEPSAYTKVSALGVEEQRVNVIIDLVDPPETRQTLGDLFRVEARIVVWEGDDILKVPTGALFRNGDQWAVFVVASTVAQLRQVELGHQNDTEAEAIDGLSPDDTVILHPGDKIQDGTEIVAR
jgi:HlyD family secretion protein